MFIEPIVIYEDDYIKVLCMDEKGPGGAHHYYQVIRKSDGEDLNAVLFQEGPIKEVGVNDSQTKPCLLFVGIVWNAFRVDFSHPTTMRMLKAA